MADDDLEVLTDGRKALVQMRQDLAKAIAAGSKGADANNAIERIAEVQQAIEVIDIAIDELEEGDDDE